MAADVLSALLDHSFKRLSFPSTSYRISLRHDLAQHKFADLDGANIEATGRAPLQFEARIPFLNGIARGSHELWKDPLYPTAFREFFAACADKSTGTLMHPEFGAIQVKTESCTVNWDALKRGGVEVDVTWLETVIDDSEFANFLASDSPSAALADASATADAAAGNSAIPNVPQLPTFTYSFQDLTNGLTAIANLPSLLDAQVGGRIASLSAQASQLLGAVQNINNVLYWPLTEAAQQIIAATNNLRNQILAKNQAILLYVTPFDATLAAIATQIQADLGDVFTLNAQLLESPIVPKGTIVRYYETN